MRKRLLWRRSATALGIYGSTALGILGSLVVLRVLGPDDAGRFGLVIGTTAFFQLLLELTSDEALIKFGFRYAAQEDWGRFRRLLWLTGAFEGGAAILAGVLIAALAPFAGSIFNGRALTTPLLVAALLPPLQAIEALGAAGLILRSRYDVRGGLLTFSMALRLAAIVVGAPRGVTTTVALIVAAQAVTSVVVGGIGLSAIGRFPRAPAVPLGEDRQPVLRFVLQSSIGTGLVSLRSWIAPLALGVVRTTLEVGYFRAAQAPQQGFAALSSPVRLILMTEQTRDWERGRPEVVWAGLRRYVVGSTVLMAVVLVPLELAMPWFVRIFLGGKYAPATDAARLVLVAAAIQLVFGWSKSFPISIGRPGLRIVAHGVEAAVLVPLIVVFGKPWGATGAAGAILVSTLAFAAVWIVLLVRLRREPRGLPVTAA